MRTYPAYFVINEESRRIKRVSQRWPSLASGEIVVRIALDIPDALLPNLQVIELEDPQYIAITSEGAALEVPA